MDELNEVSSTTKDESASTDSPSTSTTETTNNTENGTLEVVDALDPHDEGNSFATTNSRKRKSIALDDDEEIVESESVSSRPTTPTTSVTTSMEIDDVGQKEIDSSLGSEDTLQTNAAEMMISPEDLIPEQEVELRVSYNKEPILIRISLKKTVGDLKKMIESVTKIAPELQKVLIKGIAKDEMVLESLGLSAGSKVMVIGTKLDDVLAVNQPPVDDDIKGQQASSSTESQNWCSVIRHQKIIDKGIPDDAMPGILDCNDPLPSFPISGMVSSKGSKLRLTFKLEADEVWIGTKERTEKVPIGSVRSVITQPIAGFEHYHILALQLGPTEASRLFIYWFPAQYVRAVKDALGA